MYESMGLWEIHYPSSSQICDVTLRCSVVLEHCETARRERPQSNGIKKFRLERKTNSEESILRRLERQKRERGSSLMSDGIESGRVGWQERGGECERSWREWKRRIRRAKGTPINTFWLPQVSQRRDRSAERGRRRRVGGRKDNRSGHSSGNTKECHIFCQLGASPQATQGNEPRWLRVFDVRLASVVDSKWTRRYSFPNCTHRTICLPINHSTFVYATHYLNQIQFKADCQHDRLLENWCSV